MFYFVLKLHEINLLSFIQLISFYIIIIINIIEINQELEMKNKKKLVRERAESLAESNQQ